MAADDAAIAKFPASSKGSRRKRKRDDLHLDEAERSRRQLQRQKQELAIKLRSEGKVYKPQKASKDADKADRSQSGKHAVRKQHNAERSDGQQQHLQTPNQREESGARPDGAVQVIIVPIFWNKRADEKDTVVALAEGVKEQIEALGISVGVDTTNADTPGQKYRYWEQKGVKVRVELGPRDAQKSQACLAISTVPGEVAKKSTYQIGAELSSAIQKALGASDSLAGIDKGVQAASKQLLASKKQKQATDTHAKAAPAAATDANSDKQPSVSQKPSDAAKITAKQSQAKTAASKLPQAALRSGDDLGDEFAIEFDAAEDAGVKKKSKSVINPAAQVSDAMINKPKSKKAKHKVVQF